MLTPSFRFIYNQPYFMIYLYITIQKNFQIFLRIVSKIIIRVCKLLCNGRYIILTNNRFFDDIKISDKL